ncbi:helix-turn-helix domain-containing protein [Comamonas thiooxydans]|uniref:helix-turn-helix domain-containing protein n=1 Tax=Comamonas thiooxydans TaxID=363952 RepID=UPI00209C28C1|nr:helix-turn-helix transcriptional regulator [Comamonas thiooxydans]MCO8251818.1 helix-turn-helix domain-containing protein [Comamonas thiooxydans]
MSDADEQWGARLKQARLAAGLSQKMLGIEAGIDAFVASTRINRYELGIHKPDLLTVRKLAEVLKVPVAFFYADTDDEIADLLFRYGKADEEARLKIQVLLAEQLPPQDI